MNLYIIKKIVEWGNGEWGEFYERLNTSDLVFNFNITGISNELIVEISFQSERDALLFELGAT